MIAPLPTLRSSPRQPSLRGASATKQSSFLAATKEAGLLRFARNDGGYFGPEIVFDDPSGADCMPGGVSPCGLEAGAPPLLPVVIGPVGPCG